MSCNNIWFFFTWSRCLLNLLRWFEGQWIFENQWTNAIPVFLPGESHGQRSLGGLLSMGSHRVRHNWSDLACRHALEKEMATRSSILAWRILWTEEPGGLLSMGSHRVRHDWSDLACMHAMNLKSCSRPWAVALNVCIKLYLAGFFFLYQ